MSSTQTEPLRTAIYVSASNWAPLTRPAKPLAAQSEACRAFIARHPELKRAATYRNRYESGDSGDYRRLLEDAVNRRFDCLVMDGAFRFGAMERQAFFNLARFMLPAGIRLVDVAEGTDTAENVKGFRNHIPALARMERRAEKERKGASGHGA